MLSVQYFLTNLVFVAIRGFLDVYTLISVAPEIREEEKKSVTQKVTHSIYLKDYTGDAMKLRVK